MPHPQVVSSSHIATGHHAPVAPVLSLGLDEPSVSSSPASARPARFYPDSSSSKSPNPPSNIPASNPKLLSTPAPVASAGHVSEAVPNPSTMGESQADADDCAVKPPVRNTNLAEISHAVTADSDTDFHRSTFALKRTVSMGLFDTSMRPSMSADLVGSMEDYPHLQKAECPEPSQPTPPAATEVPQPSEQVAASVERVVPAPAPALSTASSTRTSSSADEEMRSNSATPSPPGTPDLVAPTLDDSVIQYEPSRQVDYLSHDWKESDISSSWRYIVLRRKDMANSARLENASWRTWTKAKYNLKTVAPESVNWLKDYDVTWLYGPLYDEPQHTFSISPDLKTTPSPKMKPLSTASTKSRKKASQDCKKPILKKRSVSQMMMSRPPLLSNTSCTGGATCTCPQHHAYRQNVHSPDEVGVHGEGVSTYLRHHNYRHRPRAGQSSENISNAINQQYYRANEAKPVDDERAVLHRSSTATGPETASLPAASPVASPNVTAERHIHFNDRVEQCISLDTWSDNEVEEEPSSRGRPRASSHSSGKSSFFTGGDSDEESDDDAENDDDREYDESDNGEDEPGLFLMVRSASSTSLHKSAFRSIAPLPATTLKYRLEESERDARERQTADSVAYAMSHNSSNQRHGYTTYDYNSVYVSPDPSPSHSPRESMSIVNVSSGSIRPSPPTSAAPSSVQPQTTTASAGGELLNSYPVASSVLLERSLPGGSPSSGGSTSSLDGTFTTKRWSDPELASSEFVEDTANPAVVSAAPVASVISPQIPSTSDENSADKGETHLNRINSAVSSAKGLAHSLWNGHWTK